MLNNRFASCPAPTPSRIQWRIQDFPHGGAPTPKITIIFQIFAKNCMKMKEFGPPGGRIPGAPLGSANGIYGWPLRPLVGNPGCFTKLICFPPALTPSLLPLGIGVSPRLRRILDPSLMRQFLKTHIGLASALQQRLTTSCTISIRHSRHSITCCVTSCRVSH